MEQEQVLDAVEQTTENNGIISKLFKIQSFLDLLSTYKVYIILVILLLIMFIYLLESKYRINKQTKSILNELQKQKKYIPNLFSEINSTMEILRYYIYGKKWKRKLIKEFNVFYNKNKIITKNYPDYINYFHLSIFYSLKKIKI